MTYRSFYHRFPLVAGLAILISCFFSCSKEIPQPDQQASSQDSCTDRSTCRPDSVERTIFMYYPWSSNLLPYFRTNLSDMETAIRTYAAADERIIAFISTGPTEAQMIEVSRDGNPDHRLTLKEYQSPEFTTVSGLTGILRDMKDFSPSRQYSMIIGSHGMGWLPVSAAAASRSGRRFTYHWESVSAPLTRFFGGLTPAYQTDIHTLAESLSNNSLKLEYLLFDDCYMSSLEVAYELRHVTAHLVACPTEIMIYGMPYALMGKYLLAEQPDYQAICQAFYEFYSTYKYPYGTLAVTDCSQLDALAALMKEINASHSFSPSLSDGLQRMDGYTPVIFYDYADYVKSLCGTDRGLYSQFTELMTKAVPYKTHTEQFYSEITSGTFPIRTYSGITTSEPSQNPITESYQQTLWYRDTH